MKVQDYLKDAEGFGIMTTVDSSGRPNAAVYSKPHVMEDDTIAFIMLERLTYNNLKSNPSAAYLFLENHETEVKFKGLRICLTKLREEKNTALLNIILIRVMTLYLCFHSSLFYLIP